MRNDFMLLKHSLVEKYDNIPDKIMVSRTTIKVPNPKMATKNKMDYIIS